jgi:hypothetical protein
MTVEEFNASLSKVRPPAGVAPALVALWWASKDDWKKAHAIVMDESSKECAWVHAHLHRLEGDLENARYWYRQAKRPVATGSLAGEWDDIARTLLGAPQL